MFSIVGFFLPPILYGILFYVASIAFIYSTIGPFAISIYLSRSGTFAWTLIAMVPNLILSILIIVRGIFTMAFVLTLSVLLTLWMWSRLIFLKSERLFAKK